MTDRILEVRGLEKRYGSVRALKGIDLSIERGSIYGFLGPNAAGKTTTIRIVAGLVRPTAGSVRLQGRDLATDRLAAAHGLRTLVEVPAFYPNLSGRENLGIHARLTKTPLSEVDRLLEEGRANCHQEERIKYYHRFQEILAQDQPVVFLYFRDALPAISSRVQGVRPAPSGIFHNFTQWYVPTRLQRYTSG